MPEVVRVFGSSRRYAEIHFKAVVGRTIMEEIRRVKLDRVCALLQETNLSIGEIAEKCDFASESRLGIIFRKRHGMTMSAYRKAARRLTQGGRHFFGDCLHTETDIFARKKVGPHTQQLDRCDKAAGV